ncbi:MAG: acyl-CoA thioesterase [Armatimonadetes bacterium CG2_30_59_28]|nr:acyl-CoA thioesterase [Armatimonadota bacterium]OIO95879.1 MAG: acyl-CoA thioesterase [Armatimonadetes bacterium CG2_30_59_28]PIU67423.1 MAG: acyl-CoA thioesterase [Armatimonadetes bacterium CG07_land_8_20_14_0_80_59_28]PIY48849.1 MAG: acyl-CoA thioesterase [Armatimonadetes bacterium CG_4_10_14_3_um_filter_59_10]PJB61747.1 MAG: acyl-CoA thioesterase [Armatimonadetes bacterium CG_4_9_14_3_um_filter_58_7]
MESHRLVLPEHLSHYGFLFGGYMMKWVDEFAWIAARLDYPECNFLTIALDGVEFKKTVRGGTILRFVVEKMKTGNTSVQYQVNVFRRRPDEDEIEEVFSTRVTLVCVDSDGKKTRLPR